MKAPTKRDKAEALVALIRREYPDPEPLNHNDISPDWYCVLTAAEHYTRKYDVFNQWRATPMIQEIAALNDGGNHEEAWAKLVDYFSEEEIK